jgi:acetylornithine deacetylase
VGVWRGVGGGKTLLFNGHLDTNPVTEGWTVDPWGGLVRDGMIYGIGVSNMSKSTSALALHARVESS